MQLCRVEHFFNIFVLTFGRDCWIQYNTIDVVKVFNSTELHFSEVTSFKIGTLAIFMPRNPAWKLKISGIDTQFTSNDWKSP